MNDNTALLDRYLQNELTGEEKSALEKRLSSDVLLKQELDLQLQIIKSIEWTGLKKEFAEAFKKERRIKKIWRWSILILILISIVLLLHHVKNYYHHQ